MSKNKRIEKTISISQKEIVERILVLSLPSVIIFILTLLSFTHFFAGLGLIVISLMFLFPMLFFLQGIYSVKRVNIFLSTTVSSISYLVALTIFLNETALIYLPAYIVLDISGYFFYKRYSMKNNKN